MSEFKYPLKKYYLWMMLYIFMSIFTLSLLAPLAYYLYTKRNVENTYIDGKKLRFDGTIKGIYFEFVPRFLIAFFLIIFYRSFKISILTPEFYASINAVIAYIIKKIIDAIPAIIGSYFIFYSLFRWGVNHTHLCYYYDEESYMEKHLIRSIILAILCKIFSAMTILILNPIAIKLRQGYIVEREVFSKRRMTFSGTIKNSYKTFIWKQYLYLFLTLFYFPVFLYKIYEWRITNTHISVPV